MSIKSTLSEYLPGLDSEDLLAVAELVRRCVCTDTPVEERARTLSDKDCFGRAFMCGLRSEYMDEFSKVYPEENCWYLRVRTGRFVRSSFEEDCGCMFAKFEIPSIPGETYEFFSALEDCAADDELFLRIIDKQPRMMVTLSSRPGYVTEPVWDVLCKMQGSPEKDDFETLLCELADGHGVCAAQLVAPDKETVVAFYGMRESWQDPFCPVGENFIHSEDYYAHLNASCEENDPLHDCEEKLYWAPGWDAASFAVLSRSSPAQR